MNACGKSSPSRTEVRILLVDDDKICLAITASVLKLFNYEVVTMSCPLEALSTLRMNQESFDIILSDVHMPLMNGLKFQSIVEVEFHIPVILMSADDKKNLLMQSLQNGAVFFIVKPPKITDLQNIWQYVISRRTGSRGVGAGNGMLLNANPEANINRQPPLYANNDQRLLPNVERADNNVEGRSTKRPKLVWTTGLHNKFLEAINVIGTHRAVPKKIMEYMNVPGLTRENIASHLQKYRIFTKRLKEANGAMEHGMPVNWNERPFRSSFSWSQFPSLASNSFLLKYSNAINNQTPPQGLNTSMPFPNLSRPTILESSILEEDESITAAREFITPRVDPYANNRGMLRMNMNMNNEYISHGIPNPPLSISGNNRFMGSIQPQLTIQERNYLDSGLDNIGSSMNFTAPLLATMRNGDNELQVSGTSGLNFVGQAAQPEGAHISSAVELDNPSNVSAGQMTAENNVNANLESGDGARDKDISTLNLIGVSSASLQDWAPYQFDDYFSMEYGIEDITAILSNIEGQNGNNNN